MKYCKSFRFIIAFCIGLLVSIALLVTSPARFITVKKEPQTSEQQDVADQTSLKLNLQVDDRTLDNQIEPDVASIPDEFLNDAINQVVGNLAVDADRLLQTVNDVVGERFTNVAREKVRSLIETELIQVGWHVKEQLFTDGVNVIAYYPQSIRARGDKIIVAAHYDTVSGSPGADDNGTGVAVLLELAHLFAEIELPKPLELVFFDREETGLQGSFAFTQVSENLDRLQGAIVLDMVGYACDQPGCQAYPQGLPVEPPSEKGDFLAIVGDLEHLDLLRAFQAVESSVLLYTLPVPFKGILMPDVLRSDHAPFWLNGIGAVLVTDTGNLRNPHYHQASDQLETLDRDFFAAAAQAIVDAILVLESQPS